MHPVESVLVFTPLRPCSVGVNTFCGDARPYRSTMLEHQFHIGWLTEDAHIRQYAVVGQIVRADAVAAILASGVFAPLRLLNLTGDGTDYQVTDEFNARAL